MADMIEGRCDGILRGPRRNVQVQKRRTNITFSIEFKRSVCRLRDINIYSTWERFCYILVGETEYVILISIVRHICRNKDMWFAEKTLMACLVEMEM